MAVNRLKETRVGNGLSIKHKNALWGYFFIIPWIIGFLLFTVYPFFYSIFISLSKVNISPRGIQTVWVGLSNYSDVFTKDINFSTILVESIIFVTLSTPMIVVASITISLLLNGKFRGRGIFRAIYFLPVIIISGPVMAELIGNKVMTIVNPSKYFVYKFFSSLPSLVGMPVLYVFDNLVMILWFSGVQILIFLAGLQKVDISIYEAARIDGASSWEVFWKIVLPYLKPLALINAIYTIVEMSSFPNNKVNTEITVRMFQTGSVYSYSTAMAWIYFLVVLAMLGFSYLLLKERSTRR